MDHKVARFTPYYGASYKAAPLSDKQIYERPDDASLKKTVVDVAGEYKVRKFIVTFLVWLIDWSS